MKLNKKGTTLIEIIVSLVIISLVLIVLVRLLASFKKQSNMSNIRNDFIMNQSLITKSFNKSVYKNKIKDISIDNNNIINFKISSGSYVLDSLTCNYIINYSIVITENTLTIKNSVNYLTNTCDNTNAPSEVSSIDNNIIYKRTLKHNGTYGTPTLNKVCNNGSNIYSIKIPVTDKYENNYNIILNGLYDYQC